MRRGRMALSGAAALLAWGEWVNRRWSRTLVGAPTGGTDAVVVLGYRNRTGRINAVNRWRVRAGMRSARPGATLILSGGSRPGGVSEARLMSDHARRRGFAGPIVLEEASRSTWENVTNVIALLEDVQNIMIVSQPAHALKARRYLRQLRPDLAAHVVRGSDYRLGEHTLVKPALALYGVTSLRGRA